MEDGRKLVVGGKATLAFRERRSSRRVSLLPLDSTGNVIIGFGTLDVIMYLVFTIKGNRATNVLSTFGRWMMMVCFGVAFGQAVAQRTSQGAGAIQNILAIFGL